MLLLLLLVGGLTEGKTELGTYELSLVVTYYNFEEIGTVWLDSPVVMFPEFSFLFLFQST